MKNKKLFTLCLTSMFAAMTTALTIFPKIPIPGGSGGYVHLGDAMIYLASSFLPPVYAACAGAIGGGLADILSGFASYAPFTVIAKALLTIAFTDKGRLLSKRNIFACAAAMIITPGVYFLADSALAGSFAAAAPGIIWNAAQAAASLVVYVVAASVLDSLKIKQKMLKKTGAEH